MSEIQEVDSTELNFHYHREDRLKTAPKIVQDFHNGTNKVPPKGIFRRLVYTRSSRLMLFTIVVLCLGTYVVSFLTSRDNRDTLLTVPMQLSAFRFEDTVYVSLKASEKQDAAFPFTAEFTAYTTNHTPVQTEVKSALYDGKELVITTTFPDYDILSIYAEVKAKSGESITITSDITR